MRLYVQRAAARRVTKWVLVLVFLVALLTNRWVINSTSAYVYDNWAVLPPNDVGLVLGTSPYTRSNRPNPHFQGRIDAAAKLYQLGKVRHLLLSGANPDHTYNEPKRMQEALIAAGVPTEAMTLDYAGDRTYDSVARAGVVFGLKRYTIITQDYHAPRAVFLARKLGQDVIAFTAPYEGPEMFTWRIVAREWLARVRAAFEVTWRRVGGAPEAIADMPRTIDLDGASKGPRRVLAPATGRILAPPSAGRPPPGLSA